MFFCVLAEWKLSIDGVNVKKCIYIVVIIYSEITATATATIQLVVNCILVVM